MMKIENININDIETYAGNPRKNELAVDAVAESIREFGAIVPVILDDNNVIVAGHTRVMAARKLGLKALPCIRAEGLTKAQIRAYRLADNKVSEASDWDLPLLEVELDGLEQDTRDALDKMGFGLSFSEALFLSDGANELDISAFGDEAFDHECQECGFRFNDK